MYLSIIDFLMIHIEFTNYIVFLKNVYLYIYEDKSMKRIYFFYIRK